MFVSTILYIFFGRISRKSCLRCCRTKVRIIIINGRFCGLVVTVLATDPEVPSSISGVNRFYEYSASGTRYTQPRENKFCLFVLLAIIIKYILYANVLG
jgi:hypothetical protein